MQTALPGIHNYAAERALRGVAIGSKNYLHLGLENGPHSAAVTYTLISSAELVGIDLQAYLRHVLGRTTDLPRTRIDELCPWAVTGLPVRAKPMTSAPPDKLAAGASQRAKIVDLHVEQIKDIPLATLAELHQLSCVIEQLMDGRARLKQHTARPERI